MKGFALAIALAFSVQSFASQGPQLKCRSLFSSQVPLFSSRTPLHLEIKADFAEVQANRARNADGGAVADEAGPTEGEDVKAPIQASAKTFTHATIRDLSTPANSGKVIRSEIRSRGHSSADPGESEFPKLKVEIEEGQDLGSTVFAGSRKFRINTHVSTHPKTLHTKMFSRLNNENSPWREALAYEWARILGLKTPEIRRARITYVDKRETFTRNGLLIETDAQTAKRLGGTAVTTEDFAAAERSLINPVEGATFHLFHRLIGNYDFTLRVNEDSAPLTEISNPNWNVNVITSRNGIRRYPVVYDLDVAEMVTGNQSTDFAMPPGFGDIPAGLQAEQVAHAAELLRHFSKSQLKLALARMRAQRDKLYEAARTADIDKEGRAIALKRLDSFFAGVEKVLSFKVVADANVRFYKDPGKKSDKLKPNPVNESPETLRVGTPISVLGREGDMLKVAILSSGVRDLLPGEDEIGYIDARSVILDEVPVELLKKVDLRDYVF